MYLWSVISFKFIKYINIYIINAKYHIMFCLLLCYCYCGMKRFNFISTKNYLNFFCPYNDFLIMS